MAGGTVIRAFPILAVAGFIGWTLTQQHAEADRRVLARATSSGQDFRWTGTLSAGQSIEIKGVNGAIEAAPATGNDVVVTAVKREGRRGDPRDVTIEVLEHGDGVTVCAVYPSSDWDRPNECAPGSRGRMNVRRNDTKVFFTVRVPEHIDFIGRTVNGDVETGRLGGNVFAATVNGDIEIDAAGHAEGSTVNGSIRASMGRGDWSAPLDFETVNGSITVTLPAGLGAEVRAKTVNGSIDTDFPLTVRGRFSSRSIDGVIGDGGRDLRLSTVNGGIRLRRGN